MQDPNHILPPMGQPPLDAPYQPLGQGIPAGVQDGGSALRFLSQGNVAVELAPQSEPAYQQPQFVPAAAPPGTGLLPVHEAPALQFVPAAAAPPGAMNPMSSYPAADYAPMPPAFYPAQVLTPQPTVYQQAPMPFPTQPGYSGPIHDPGTPTYDSGTPIHDYGLPVPASTTPVYEAPVLAPPLPEDLQGPVDLTRASLALIASALERLNARLEAPERPLAIELHRASCDPTVAAGQLVDLHANLMREFASFTLEYGSTPFAYLLQMPQPIPSAGAPGDGVSQGREAAKMASDRIAEDEAIAATQGNGAVSKVKTTSPSKSAGNELKTSPYPDEFTDEEWSALSVQKRGSVTRRKQRDAQGPDVESA